MANKQSNSDVPGKLERKVAKVLVPIVSTLFAGSFSTLAAGTGTGNYLKEPTVEFKDEEKRVAAFAAVQKKIRQEWDAVMVKLAASNDPKSVESALKDLKAILVKYDQGELGL
jgi:hypothetical protein